MAYLKEVLDNLPEFMDKTSGSNNYKFIKSFTTEFDNLDTNIDNLKKELQIDTMTGSYLDDFAKLFKLNRLTGESDDDFRARIKAYWTGATKGGTKNSIISAVIAATGLSESDITITEGVLRFTIEIAITPSTDITQLNNILNETIPDIIAAGVYWKQDSTSYTSSEDLFLINFSEINGEDYIL